MSGGGDSGAILAAMDAGVAPGPASTGLPGSGPGGNDNGVHVQLHALAKIHDQKASISCSGATGSMVLRGKGMEKRVLIRLRRA